MSIVLNYLQTTAPRTGFTVITKYFCERGYKVSQDEKDLLNLKRDLDIPQVNYTIDPQN